MIKGENVILPYHKTTGVVNFISAIEICIKYDKGNIWVDRNGNLPNTNLKIVVFPKYSKGEIIAIKSNNEIIVGRIGHTKIIKDIEQKTFFIYYWITPLSALNGFYIQEQKNKIISITKLFINN